MINRISMSPDALRMALQCFAVAKMRIIHLAITPNFVNELRCYVYAYIDPRDRVGIFIGKGIRSWETDYLLDRTESDKVAQDKWHSLTASFAVFFYTVHRQILVQRQQRGRLSF